MEERPKSCLTNWGVEGEGVLIDCAKEGRYSDAARASKMNSFFINGYVLSVEFTSSRRNEGIKFLIPDLDGGPDLSSPEQFPGRAFLYQPDGAGIVGGGKGLFDFKSR